MSEKPTEIRAADVKRLKELQGRLHPHCFVCTPANALGLRQDFRLGEDGGVVSVFRGDRSFEGYPKLVHGGVIASLLDGAMTSCLFARGVEALTADLRIRYLEPVGLDAEVVTRARLVNSHGRLHSLKAELSQEGKVKAVAQGKFIEKK